MISFRSIIQETIVETEVIKSKFIAHIAPVNNELEAMNFVNRIKKNNYNATHNVWAYHLRAHHEIKRYSDDGEPSGSAGMPLLQTIINHQLIDVCMVVTRYFGGTKLGVGGLVRAYSDAAVKCIEDSEILIYQLMTQYSITLPYDLLNKVQYYFSQNNVFTGDIQYLEDVTIDIFLDKNQSFIIDEITNITSSKTKIKICESNYISHNGLKIISIKEAENWK